MEGGNDVETSNAFTESSVAGLVNLELQPDYQDIFNTTELFDSREELISWVRERAIPLGIVVVVSCSEIGTERRIPRLVLSCERSGNYREPKKITKVEITDTIEENLERGKDMKKGNKNEKKTGTKKCGCPFRLKGHYFADICQWSLHVVCGYHNHVIGQYLEGHAFTGRLSSEEERLVGSMSSAHTRPKQILAALQKEFPQNTSTIKTIYNMCHKHRYLDHAGRSQMQYLLGKLEEHGYYQYTRRCLQTNVVKDMFYAHPMSEVASGFS